MRWPNFYNAEFFKMRFGRDPKMWTISQVHDLWLLAKERNEKRYKDISDHLNHIRDTCQKNGDGEWIVYFEQEGNVRGYSIRELESGHLAYSLFDPKMGRELKINLITREGFVLGERLNYLVNLTSRFEYVIFEHLSRMIQEKLFKDLYLVPYNLNNFRKVIRISGKTYLFDGRKDRSEMLEIREEDIVSL